MAIARVLAGAALWAAIASAAMAQNVAGEFDHFVLALSWSPSWCAADPRADQSEQCAANGPKGFIAHGLWPQHRRGWPEFCATGHSDPQRADARAMADIMGSAGLAGHAWRKHGRCSGLSADAYFALTRRAYEGFRHPALPRPVDGAVSLSRRALEELIRQANPHLADSRLVLRCEGPLFRELRLCLSKELTARSCAADVRDNCELNIMIFPVR